MNILFPSAQCQSLLFNYLALIASNNMFSNRNVLLGTTAAFFLW